MNQLAEQGTIDAIQQRIAAGGPSAVAAVATGFPVVELSLIHI